MMKSVKHTIYSLGDRGGDFARAIGSDSYDLARRFGSGSADLAKHLGSGTADIAKRIGPKRGLIGLAVLAAAIGGTVVLVRYLRARNADAALDGESDESVESRNQRNRRRGRAQHSSEAANA